MARSLRRRQLRHNLDRPCGSAALPAFVGGRFSHSVFALRRATIRRTFVPRQRLLRSARPLSTPANLRLPPRSPRVLPLSPLPRLHVSGRSCPRHRRNLLRSSFNLIGFSLELVFVPHRCDPPRLITRSVPFDTVEGAVVPKIGSQRAHRRSVHRTREFLP